MNPELLNKINESSAKLQAGGADMSNFDSAMNKLGSVSTETLSAQPEFDVSAADTQIETPTVDRMQQESAVDAGVRKNQKDALLDSVSQAKTEASAASETSFDDYLTSILEAPTFSQIQNKQYEKYGVDEKQLAVDKYDTQLLAEQDALRTRIERIQREGGGLQSGAQSEIANHERESLAKQADLALLQMAAQDQLEYSTNVANRAVNAMFERQEKIEGVRREIYERNKEIFDKNEQREFEISLADRERKLQAEKDAAKLLLDTKTEALKMLNLNGASEDVKAAVMAGQSPEEVINAAGQAGLVDVELRQMQRAIDNAQLSNALKEGRMKDYELVQLSAAEERRNAAIEAGELLPEQYEVVDEYDADFRSEPIVKEFNEAAGRRYAFEEVIKNGVKGVQDMQLVYDFMKSVDPTSVVRESEFDNAAKSGNIFAGQFTKYNEGYFGEGGFLPPEVQKSFLKAANASWSGKQTQYYNVKEEYGKKVNRQLGIENGATYLTSYEDAAPVTMAESIETAQTNDVIIQNGVKYRKTNDGNFVQITD